MVKRQPAFLSLDHTNVGKEQLEWLLQRLFELQGLSLQNCSRALVHSFHGSFAFLSCLDLSWLSSFNHTNLTTLLTSPVTQAPGSQQISSRFQNLLELRVAGTEVDDHSVLLICQRLKRLTLLDLSFCIHVSDDSVSHLTSPLQDIPQDDQDEEQSPERNNSSSKAPKPSYATPPCSTAHKVHKDFKAASTESAGDPAYTYCPLPKLTTLLLMGCAWINSQLVLQSQRPNLKIVHCIE